MLDPQELQAIVYEYFHAHRRNLPWRQTDDPYKILVSEIMLQQTQVNRVILKYQEFLESFPTVQALAEAPLAAVLSHWSGLGYNRRAKYLHEAAKQLQTTKHWTLETLTACKGIGYNTAAAVLTYAYNEPHVFIETNVRTVYIHHFFADQIDVDDKAITDILKITWDYENPREFAWALMDYGSHLKQTVGNFSRYSRHYAKQSKFEGSLRQVRGQVLKTLLTSGASLQELQSSIPDERLSGVLETLQKEGLIKQEKACYYLP